MKRDHRRSVNKEVIERVWDRWGEGLGLAEISRVLRIRSKQCLLSCNEPLRQLVTCKLLIDWPPQQISEWLKRAYSHDETISKSTRQIVAALSKQVRKLPSQLRRPLTWDRGIEMTHHKAFSLATQMQVYFCDPHSPWQRGSNGNTNGLLRQYFPKGRDVSQFSQRELDHIANRLNQRPGKTLGFNTPAQVFAQSVALTD